jgi:hypothetical protein
MTHCAVGLGLYTLQNFEYGPSSCNVQSVPNRPKSGIIMSFQYLVLLLYCYYSKLLSYHLHRNSRKMKMIATLSSLLSRAMHSVFFKFVREHNRFIMACQDAVLNTLAIFKNIKIGSQCHLKKSSYLQKK